MADEKVEAWKKKSPGIIDGLDKELEKAVKEFQELEKQAKVIADEVGKLKAELDKKIAALKAELEKRTKAFKEEEQKKKAVLEKKWRAVQQNLRKVTEGISEKISLEGFAVESKKDVETFEKELRERANQKGKIIKTYGLLTSGSGISATKISIGVSIAWTKDPF
jgi:seryl-tRNA synthetase